RGKGFDREMPHRFGRSEVEERDAVDALDRPRVELRGAADGVEIDRAVLLQGRQRFRAHAAFADHRADAVALDDFRLVWLLTDARRRPGGRDAPALALLHDDRAAMIEDR